MLRPRSSTTLIKHHQRFRHSASFSSPDLDRVGCLHQILARPLSSIGRTVRSLMRAPTRTGARKRTLSKP